MLYMEDLERGIAFYRDQLGFQVFVFGHHPERGVPLIAGAKLEDAFVLLTREEVFAVDGATRTGSAHLYFHLETPVDELYGRYRDQPDLAIVQPPTDQHWGDRTLLIRDPWGVLLVFSNAIAAS
jgi:uncharacterized glyoxalase superfamily protein PhnB